jgi:hypothetical protein
MLISAMTKRYNVLISVIFVVLNEEMKNAGVPGINISRE